MTSEGKLAQFFVLRGGDPRDPHWLPLEKVVATYNTNKQRVHDLYAAVTAANRMLSDAQLGVGVAIHVDKESVEALEEIGRLDASWALNRGETIIDNVPINLPALSTQKTSDFDGKTSTKWTDTDDDKYIIISGGERKRVQVVKKRALLCNDLLANLPDD